MKFKDNIVLITGSTKGIGFAIAENFVKEGAEVILCSRKEENVRHATELLGNSKRVHPRVFHVGKLDSHAEFIAEICEQIGCPNILINNAASNPFFGPMLELSWDAWEKTMETNLKAPFSLSKILAQKAIERASPLSIVNISSIFGLIPAPHQGIYGMTKAAMIAMTKTLAQEWGEHGIRVNAIAPGLIDTHFASAIVQNPLLSSAYTKRSALSRVGTPDDISGMAVFLCSQEAKFITGQTMIVDGGYI